MSRPWPEVRDPARGKYPVEILVVDDDPVACARLKAYFSAEGYAVFVARDGGEMQRVFDSEAISVVLLDVGLPGKDGLELARELRAHDELGIILVVAAATTWTRSIGLGVGRRRLRDQAPSSRSCGAGEDRVLRGLRGRGPKGAAAKRSALAVGPSTSPTAACRAATRARDP